MAECEEGHQLRHGALFAPAEFRKKSAARAGTGPARAARSTEAYFAGFLSWLPSGAQPPLPLQEFLPLQPLSPVLQPPLPLQEFLPAQSCLSAALSAARVPALIVVLPEVVLVAACATDPVRRPARAAPASRVVAEGFIYVLCVVISARRPVFPRQAMRGRLFYAQPPEWGKSSQNYN